ncbi:UNVERIFIED_CONTAM: hypothetical protein NCL1_52412 [Trichonephila clavipes]
MQWNNILPYRTVARWIGKFQQGRVSTSDEQRLGRPFNSKNKVTFQYARVPLAVFRLPQEGRVLELEER